MNRMMKMLAVRKNLWVSQDDYCSRKDARHAKKLRPLLTMDLNGNIKKPVVNFVSVISLFFSFAS